MNKIVFTNSVYFVALTSILLLLILYKGFIAIVTGNIFAIPQVVIQFILYFLVVTRHKFTPTLLKFWALVFLIGLSAIKMISILLIELGNGFVGFSLEKISMQLSMLVIGCLLILGSYRFIRPAS